MPVLPSDQVPVIGSPGTGIVLIDATGIAGDCAIVSLDRATQASLQMDDSPTQASGGTGSPEMSGGSTMVSLFQTNSVALRAERYFGAQRLRTAAVQILVRRDVVTAMSDPSLRKIPGPPGREP